jgi:general secretion pathway protein A
MYKSFFNLTRYPFDLPPDPTCFVPTKRHNETLASLYHGVRRHKGFVVVTGEVGTGKTLLLRCLLELFKESKDIAYAYLFNARLSSKEFLQHIVSDFGLPVSGKSRYEILLDLGRFLASRGEKGMTTVLVVDEAHHLSADLLEEIRLLSNLETVDDKLLQIVLVGQPELDDKLDSNELRQLKQRIAVRARLEPLDADETKRYIEQRLQIAGADSNRSPIFPEATIATVYRLSQGLPRLINTICENALISAYAIGLPSVNPEIVEYVAKELRLDVVCAQKDEKSESTSKMDFQQALNSFLDQYDARRNTVTGESDLIAALAGKAREHEPHI